jgi:hypothetical protein
LRLFGFALLAACLAAAAGNAQCTRENSQGARPAARLLAVGTAADDSARLGSFIGACWGNGSLIRSSVSLIPATDLSAGLSLSAIDPSLTSTWNSQIPVSFNDGAMWAGRGLNIGILAGFRASFRRLRVVVAPRIVTSQNLQFPILPSGNTSRSPFASPWRLGPLFADLPLRFGDRRYTRIDPGESTVEIALPVVAVGVTSAGQWWGPGIRNALVLSNNAAGIPQGYLRTVKPLRTRLGDVEAHWMLGGLEESPFFDIDTRNTLRSMSAAAITLRVAADSGLTIGAARAVYANVRRFSRLPEHVGDVLLRWPRPPLEGQVDRTSDQITSLFARWAVPDAGIAAHVEWALARLPASFRDLLVEPQVGEGYTLGLEWAKVVSSTTVVRAQAEVTTLEQIPATIGGLTPEFYTSHAVIQGYTQEGQSVGAAIAPGSSSQYLGATLIRGDWQVGANIGRIRWEEGAYYREPSQGRFAWRTHDVSIFAGLNARRDSRWAQIEVSLLRTLRMNYLFQTPDAFLPHNTGFDMRNTTISFGVVPHLSSLRFGRR